LSYKGKSLSLRKNQDERFQFFFIGEGACADSPAQCYVTGKPALAIPCFGERRFGEVLDEEMVLALPPPMVELAIEGMRRLAQGMFGLGKLSPCRQTLHSP